MCIREGFDGDPHTCQQFLGKRGFVWVASRNLNKHIPLGGSTGMTGTVAARRRSNSDHAAHRSESGNAIPFHHSRRASSGGRRYSRITHKLWSYTPSHGSVAVNRAPSAYIAAVTTAPFGLPHAKSRSYICASACVRTGSKRLDIPLKYRDWSYGGLPSGYGFRSDSLE